MTKYAAHTLVGFALAGLAFGGRMTAQEGAPGISLLASTTEKPLKKSTTPVVAISTPNLEEVVKGLEAAGQPVFRAKITDTFTIAIAREPGGNAIEILPGNGKPAVAGSRLVVDNREKAEGFFTRVFGLGKGQFIQNADFDEVILRFGEAAAFLALFEPKNEAPLPKSEFPVVAIFTSDFDGVLARIKQEGLPFSTPRPTMIIAQDPAGNAVEILKQ